MRINFHVDPVTVRSAHEIRIRPAVEDFARGLGYVCTYADSGYREAVAKLFLGTLRYLLVMLFWCERLFSFQAVGVATTAHLCFSCELFKSQSTASEQIKDGQL